MSKLIKIVNSPFNPAVEVAGNIVISLHVPYTDDSVTIQVNPNVQDYQEKADTKNIRVRQVMVTAATDQTKVLSFDFLKNRKHNIDIEGCVYEIELMSIGKENIQGQKFPFYEFNVSSGQ